MPNTPNHALPYPAATDPVNQGATNFQNLATKLDSEILVPVGGTVGQYLAKKTATNFDVQWVSLGGGFVPAGGTTGQVLVKASATDFATAWQTPSGGGGGTQGSELAFAEFTADVTCVATTEATANPVVTAPSVVFDGSPVIIEFYAQGWLRSAGSGVSQVVLWDNTANVSLGLLSALGGPQSGVDGQVGVLARRFTPAAGARVYSIRGYVTTGNLVFHAGPGGAGNRVPGYMRIVKV